MSANVNDEMFQGGPLLRLERSLGLANPDRPWAGGRRALLAVVVCWVPLAVLNAYQFLIVGDEAAKSFFTDFAVNARYLMAIPALIYAEEECIPRLRSIAQHFRDSGLIVEKDKPRYEAVIASTRRLLFSSVGDLVILVVVYFGVVAVALYFSTKAAAIPWHRQGATGFQLSPAGWWHVVVSLPLLLIIFLSWLWRLALWSRFLFVMSRLDLHLIAGHPDGVGGLKFVVSSLRGFRFISFAVGAVVAGTIANRQVHHGSQPLDFKNTVIGMLVFLVIIFAGPMTVFLQKLRNTKRYGTFEYGALARTIGVEFEEKWLRRKGSVNAASLDVQDFSATTDLYTVVDNVYAMRELPFTLRDLIGPIGVAAMVPFIPVALLALPMEVILKAVVKLLF